MTNGSVIEDLGDRLVLRRGTREDADAVADFNAKIHRDEPSGTEAWWIAAWTRDLMSGDHPTVQPSDALIVEDTKRNRIASSTLYMTDTWTYGGFEFAVGRPELVGTAPEFRNRGLIRRQFEEMHRWAEERGHELTVVLGIPIYYRQFGYDFALHEGGRSTSIQTLPRWGEKDERTYRLRDATEDDIPFITRLLNQSTRRSLVSPHFREDWVRYMTFGRRERSALRHLTGVLCKADGDGFGEPIGVVMYAMTIEIDEAVILRIEMESPSDWRDASKPLLCEFARLADEASTGHKDPERAIKRVRQDLQPDHPIYAFEDGALGSPPERQYGWYVRVPDLAGFLGKIGPVLERRVDDSLHAGMTGEVRLLSGRHGVVLDFKDGKLVSSVASNEVQRENATAHFPDLTFLQILFGMRSLDEVMGAFPDAGAKEKSGRELISTMFPKATSDMSLTLA